MPIQFAIPTHGRPFGMTTHISLMRNGVQPEDIHIFFHTDDERERYESIQIFPTDINIYVTDTKPGVTNARNAMFQRMQCPYIMADDDITGMYCLDEAGKRFIWAPDTYVSRIASAFTESLQRGYALFGCATHFVTKPPSKRSVMTNKPFYGGIVGVMEHPPAYIPTWVTHAEDLFMQWIYLLAGKTTARFEGMFVPIAAPVAGGCDTPTLRRALTDFQLKQQFKRRWGDKAARFFGRPYGTEYVRACIRNGTIDREIAEAGVSRNEMQTFMEYIGKLR